MGPFRRLWMPMTVAAASDVAGHPVACLDGEGYCEREAILQSYLSTAAYCGLRKSDRQSVEAWQCGPSCEHVSLMSHARQVTSDGLWSDASVIVGRHLLSCIVAFRGTADRTGWMEDLNSIHLIDINSWNIPCSSAGGPCLVGKGWVEEYDSLRQYIKGNLTDLGCYPGTLPLKVTGHSLGGAVAQLAMFDLSLDGYRIARSNVFGSPRVGNRDWVAAFTASLGNTTVYHITHASDPVVHLPTVNMGFHHVPTEVYYPGDYWDGYKVCSEEGGDPACARSSGEVPGLLKKCVKNISQCDHLTYFMPLKINRMDGSTCLNASFRAAEEHPLVADPPGGKAPQRAILV